jgi:flagellar protein FlgJ
LQPSRDERLAEFAKAAVVFERETGYPAAAMVAMWAQESGWGKSMPEDSCNCFGLTYRPRHQGYAWAPTFEIMTPTQVVALDADEKATITSKVARPDGKYHVRLKRKFAKYPTLLDCIRDKYKLLTGSKRYADAVNKAIKAKDAEAVINAVAAGGWASDPGYAKSLIAISKQRNVLDAINKARANS